MTFYEKVANIQAKLSAPKGQTNKFGGYKYRSCEDILEAAKKVKGDLIIIISDEIHMVSDRVYVKATATITDGKSSISNSAFAREPFSKKGMDDSQITGTASSYARKYALNGLLCIDDNKDADTNEHYQQSNSGANNDPTKEQVDLTKKLHKYASDDHTPMELYYFIESQRDKKPGLYEWIYNQFPKDGATKGKEKARKGGSILADCIQVMKCDDQLAKDECWAELTDLEKQIVTKELEKRNAL